MYISIYIYIYIAVSTAVWIFLPPLTNMYAAVSTATYPL